MFFNKNRWNVSHPTLRGVNLGGWLVIEKWLTPSLFDGTDALDEYELHQTQKPEIISNHYINFITEEDFEFLIKHEINAIRIPVGHWLFGDYPPFPSTFEYLDFAFDMADKHKIKVLLDLHTAPGSQNGYDHSGLSGSIEWPNDYENINNTLKTLESLAKRYGRRECLFGIELLNEPHSSININLLKDFYEKGYELVRDNSSDQVGVVISDAFRPQKWKSFMSDKYYKNVYLDIHFYQCFTESNKTITIEKYISNSKNNWTKLIKHIQNDHPVICGEWSLGIYPHLTEYLTNDEEKIIKHKFAQAQLEAFSNSYGWFFWNYKKEGNDGWNFRSTVEEGIIMINPIKED